MRENKLSRRDFAELCRPSSMPPGSHWTRTLIAHVGLLDNDMIGVLAEKICASENWENFCTEMCNFADYAPGVARVLMQVYRKKVPEHPIAKFTGAKDERYFFSSSLVKHGNSLRTGQMIECDEGVHDFVIVQCRYPQESFLEIRADIRKARYSTILELSSEDTGKVAGFGVIFPSSLFFGRAVKEY